MITVQLHINITIVRIKMSNSKLSKSTVFHVERNVIITANEKINGTKLEKFLLNNLDKFQEKTEFIVLSGHHHEINEIDDTVSVGKTDHILISGFNGAFKRLDHHSKSYSCKSNCQKCMWKGKNFENSSVTIETNEISNKYVISETGKIEIKSKFEALLLTKKPHVLIFASCFSHMSEINHTLRASGLYSCLLVSNERSDITLGKVCHLDKEQQVLLQDVIKEDNNGLVFLIKDVIIGGHFGTGKTMLAAEVLNIWMGRFLENNGGVDAFALTFNGKNLDYTFLNQELSSKYFQYREENRVQVSHWSDFMKKFSQVHKEELTQDQRNLLEKDIGSYKYGSSSTEEVKSVLMTVAEVLNKSKRKVIVMIDEIDIFNTCKGIGKPSSARRSYEVDFSYLRQYENVHFIICLRPFASEDFILKLPAKQRGQLYKILDLRHRNALAILKFMRFWQENDPISASPSIQNEQILDKESLPPLIEGLEHGVIWIPLINNLHKFCLSAQEKTFLFKSINDNLQKIKNQMSVAILYSRSDHKLAEKIKEIKEENYFLGPYEDHEFNGKEAEVIIYVTSENLRMQTMARARRLLILVTHPGYSGYWKDDSESVKVMNSAIEQKVVQKISK